MGGLDPGPAQRPPSVGQQPLRIRRGGLDQPDQCQRGGELVRALNDLTELLDATRQIAAQTVSGPAVSSLMGPGAGGSACTTRMPGRSPRVALQTGRVRAHR
jgi:hypothetical protein